MLDTIKNECKNQMKASVDALRKGLAQIRTGKASPALLEGISVEAYGSRMPLNQLATLAAPEPRLLTLQPFDPKQIQAIEKAIRASDLGINPVNDGSIIRLPVPPLNEERRKEYVKMAKHKGEDAKVAVRNARRDANDALKKAKDKGTITEDEMRRGEKDVQKLTDDHVAEIDKILGGKEKEIMEV